VLKRSKMGRAAIVAAYLVVFWVLLPGALFALALWLDRTFGREPSPWLGGLAIAGAGAALLAWGSVELWRGGKGLPISALPPPRLTRRGPYRIVRHPIYVGFNLLVFGAGLAIGSFAMAWIVAPVFLPLWVAYALVEERGLVRRHGESYRRYRRRVGLLPRLGLYRVAQLVMILRLLPSRVIGRENVPTRGPVVLVANHACYLDFLLVGFATWRKMHILTTAEAYRGGALAWLLRWIINVPVRRYRVDPVACREIVRLLAEGEVIAIFPEGERSVLGNYAGAKPEVANVLARLAVPVVPVGISGAYDIGPRWAGKLRRRPATLRVGPPVQWNGEDPARAIDRALRALIDEDPQRAHLEGLPRDRLHRALWRCPGCLDESGWRAEQLSCSNCGASYRPTPDGRFVDKDGVEKTLGELGRSVWEASESPLAVPASMWRERSMFGPIRPLQFVGSGTLHLGPNRLRFDDLLELPIESIRSTTTERADTLQLATNNGMWQFRLQGVSPFRLQRALDHWRGATSTEPRRRPPGLLLRRAVASAPSREDDGAAAAEE
jgi:1-acyl-sn-glycerol-3-phosphate acyltransferase